MKDEGKLKREITKRWGSVRTDATAHAQLEYILMEAGLLARPRKRRAKFDKAQTVFTHGTDAEPRHTLD